MIERLCIQSDLPKPKLAIANTRMPNAFAIGRSPKNATVCATTGIMDLLSPAELEGVMAHELSHIQNRDVLVMTLASFFATIAAYIMQFGLFFGGGHSSDDDDGPSVLVLFAVSFVVYIISFFLMQALSRYREFSADRGAAMITGARARCLGAREDLGRHAADPGQGHARPGRARRLLHLPPGRGQEARLAVLDAPADGEADRGARAPREPAAGHRRLAS
jgi:Zn-dependent protease with chaperone function